MQKKDKLFILLAGLLTTLFVCEIYLNISKEILDRSGGTSSPSVNISKVLNRLKEAGLEPREAKYYKVIK